MVTSRAPIPPNRQPVGDAFRAIIIRYLFRLFRGLSLYGLSRAEMHGREAPRSFSRKSERAYRGRARQCAINVASSHRDCLHSSARDMTENKKEDRSRAIYEALKRIFDMVILPCAVLFSLATCVSTVADRSDVEAGWAVCPSIVIHLEISEFALDRSPLRHYSILCFFFFSSLFFLFLPTFLWRSFRINRGVSRIIFSLKMFPSRNG